MGTINIKSEKQTSEDERILDRFNQLIGISEQKEQLLTHLQWIMKPIDSKKWIKDHHPNGLELVKRITKIPSLIILSGDVGCGKTELANCIGSKLSESLNNEPVWIYRAPSDIRGTGLVGELANRMTSMFESVKADSANRKYRILIIDEADDVSNSRENSEQHHEDRTGVNTLIKEIDKLSDESVKIAVIMISNRTESFDPAILRRATIEIKFTRPNQTELVELMTFICSGMKIEKNQLQNLIQICLDKSPGFTYSDLFNRIALPTLMQAMRNDEPFSYEKISHALKITEPSPQFKHHEND